MRYHILFFLIISFISCQTKMVKSVDTRTEATVYKDEKEQIKTPKKSGFRYEIPTHMEKDPDAYYYRYDDLLIEKGKNVFNSSIVIAIRKSVDSYDKSIVSFAQGDQNNMRQSVKNVFMNLTDVESLNSKGIDHISFEFSYDVDRKKIYQGLSISNILIYST